MITIHAPARNFVAITITVTTPVVAAPTPFSTALQRHPGRRVRSQYRTIPACASVNAVKTPITYRWISEFTFALKASSSPVAAAARTMIPFE
jgi:hypothetical protein